MTISNEPPDKVGRILWLVVDVIRFHNPRQGSHV